MNASYEIREHVGFMTLAGPSYNLLHDPVFADEQELDLFFRTPTLKAVIVQGKGRHFSAGADLSLLQRQVEASEYDLKDRLTRGKRLLDLLSFAPVPTLALIRGSCLGAGLEIALACHFRFAAKSALLGFPEVENLLLPGLGGTAVTPGLIPWQRALDLILSGRIVGADEALSLGLVDRVGPPGEIASLAEDYLHELTAERSPTLVRAVMEAVHGSRRLERQAALDNETNIFCRLAEMRTKK